MLNSKSQCPCGSDKRYDECCEPAHRGHQACEDPVALMRSRYSAFVLGDTAYLYQTLHSSHDDHPRGPEALAASITAHAKSIKYDGLKILDSRPPDAEGVAKVLFLARLRQRGRPASFVELSSFAREDGHWCYLFGTPVPARGLSLDGLDIERFLQQLG